MQACAAGWNWETESRLVAKHCVTCRHYSRKLNSHPGFQEVLMRKPPKPREDQLHLFQTPAQSPALPREINQKTVSLLARMLREHAGKSHGADREANDE
jgi:hypothetical protein